MVQRMGHRPEHGGKKTMRAYTPLDSGVGYVDFVIKVYFKNVHPKFPDGGKVSQYMDSLKFGETIKAQGPKGRLTYKVRACAEDRSVGAIVRDSWAGLTFVCLNSLSLSLSPLSSLLLGL